MDIDVEQIMQEIRDELKAKNDWADLPPFESVPIRGCSGGKTTPDSPRGEFAQEVEAMNRSWELRYVWPLSPNPVRRVSQRVIKRLLKFLLLQVMWQQNEFNAHTVRAMNHTKNSIDDLAEQVAVPKWTAAEIYDQSAGNRLRVELLEDQIAGLVQEVSTLQKKIAELESGQQEAEKNHANSD